MFSVQNTIEYVKREVSAVSRKISLVQDQTTKQTASCKELETGKSNIIINCKIVSFFAIELIIFGKDL